MDRFPSTIKKKGKSSVILDDDALIMFFVPQSMGEFLALHLEYIPKTFLADESVQVIWSLLSGLEGCSCTNEDHL